MAADNLQAYAKDVPGGGVLVSYLRCEMLNTTGDKLVFYSRPIMLTCPVAGNGMPVDPNDGLRAMSDSARYLFNAEPMSRA